MNKTSSTHKFTLKMLITVFVSVFIISTISTKLGDSFKSMNLSLLNLSFENNFLNSLVSACIISGTINIYRMLYLMTNRFSNGVKYLSIILVTIFLPLSVMLGMLLLFPNFIYSILVYIKLRKYEKANKERQRSLIQHIFEVIEEKRKNEINNYIKKYSLYQVVFIVTKYIILILSIFIIAFVGYAGLVLSFCISLIVFLMLNMYKFKIQETIFGISEKCDPELAFGVLYKISNLYINRNVILFEILMSNHLSALGRFIEAKAVLENIDADKIIFQIHKLYYFMAEFEASVGMEDIIYVESIRHELEKCLTDPHFKRQEKMVQGSIAVVDAYLAYEKGDYDLSKKIYLELFSKNTSNMLKVRYSYMLAQIAIRTNLKEEAIQRLEYVMQNGGTMDLVDKAKEQIRILN